MLSNKRFHKHLKLGSLQLSIEAIVVLIIAITVLGLGLSFVKTLFGGTFEKLSGISEQLGEEDKRALLNSNTEITMLTSEIHVSGKDVGINVGVRNNRKNKLFFVLQNGFQCFDAIGATDNERTALKTTKTLISFETYERKEMSPSTSAIIPVKINVEATARPTTYACKLDLKTADSETGTTFSDYSTKEFTIIKD